MFQSALAEAATGDGSNGISHAAVDFNIDYEALALGRFINAEELAAQYRHPNPQHLARADTTPVHRRSISKEIV
jgi:predicted ABC-type ATPase